MCRRQCLLGACLMALGFGILLGFCLESWFWCACCSLGLIGMGVCLVRRH